MGLYPHQEVAADWLASKSRACLFDTRGIGKTASAIVASSRRGVDSILVLCPSIVLWNWKREFHEWAPDRRVCVLDKRVSLIDPGADVVVVTHGLTIGDGIATQLLRRRWGLLIVDEAHMFRSPEAHRTVMLYGRPGTDRPCLVDQADCVWPLTGTPMPNDPTDLWTMLAALFPERISREGMPGVPVSYWAFRRRYCKLRPTPYGDGFKVVGAKNVGELRKRCEGVWLKRGKEVLGDLRMRFEQMSLRPQHLPEKLEALEAEIGPLDAYDSPMEALDALRDDSSFALYRRLVGLAKIVPVAELLREELLSGDLEKVVVMAHHVDVVKGIAAELKEFGSAVITGDVTAKERQQRIDRFQTSAACRVIVCNILAGGTGSTLTAASELVFAEMSFVPGENAQAADRIDRIGQKAKHLRVRCVSLAGTSDDNVVAALRTKMKMIRDVMK